MVFSTNCEPASIMPAEENDCGQFLLVLKVSKTTGFAYLMNGDNCYNISDNEKYQVWKQEHIGQFIGE